MKSINLYLLTRNIDEKDIFLYESLLSARDEDIKHRPKEIEVIKTLVNNMIYYDVPMKKMDGFFYSFSIPQIGKEFDLLKIGKNEVVLNIELKSEMVDLTKIEKQLVKNRYYLNNIANTIYSFAFVLDEEKVRLYTYESELKECEFDVLIQALNQIESYVTENIEEIFKPKDYLISPINTPQKFLMNRYYLTGQQEQIKKEILDGIASGQNNVWGVTGAAGTGKTLLLYDMAREQSKYGKTCIIHCGLLSEGHQELNSKMNELDIIAAKSVDEEIIKQYMYIFVDETQRIYRNTFDTIISMHRRGKAKCIFAYDYTQILSFAEERRNIPNILKHRTDFCERCLTDKIRTNKEVASFVRNMINLSDKPQKKIIYKNVDVIYANNYLEADKIIDYYCGEKDYTFIRYTPSRFNYNPIDYFGRYNYINTHRVIGQEFDNVIFSMDDNFRYSEDGHLQGKTHPNPDYIFYKLWYQGVSRARTKLCILVIGNKELFSKVISIKNGD